MQPQQGNQDQGLIQMILSIPLGSKFLLLTPLILLLLNFLTNNFFLIYFVDFPQLVLKNFQVWRLFTTQFFEASIINYILMPLFLYTQIISLERTLGTAVFLIDFFLKNFLIQVVYLVLCLLFTTTYPSLGMYNILITYITLKCFANPDQMSQLLCIPIQMKSIYIPFVLVLFGFLFGMNLSPLAALIIGVIEAKFFNFMIFRPSQATVQKLENSFLFKKVNTRTDFIKNNQNFMNQSGNGMQLPQQSPQQQQQQQQPQQQQAWQGKGVQIGGGDNELYQNNIEESQNQQQQDTNSDFRMQF